MYDCICCKLPFLSLLRIKLILWVYIVQLISFTFSLKCLKCRSYDKHESERSITVCIQHVVPHKGKSVSPRPPKRDDTVPNYELPSFEIDSVALLANVWPSIWVNHIIPQAKRF